MNIPSLLACPKCHRKFLDKKRYSCPHCKISVQRKNGIWTAFISNEQRTKKSAQEYEKLHTQVSGGPNDGSYEVFASFARGNKTVDIACGEGLIERLAPETVGVDFSLNALKKAKKNGVKHLVWADAHTLPFIDNAFDVALCAGSIEHFANPQRAILEMVRVSKIQIITAHRKLFFGANILRKLMLKIYNLPDQPIDNPLESNELEKMLKTAGSHIVFKGVWTLPFTTHLLKSKILQETANVPSCSFIIAIKK